MPNEYISVPRAMEFADTFYAHDPVLRMAVQKFLKAVPKEEPAHE